MSGRFVRFGLKSGLLFALMFLPLSLLAETSVCPLDDAADAELQAGLEHLLIENKLADAAQRGELALSLLVLRANDRPRLAQVNGHQMFYAASLPKVAILLGAAVDLESGRLTMDEGLLQDLHNMIRVSCNDCANRVLDRVGRDHLLEVLQSPQYAFYDQTSGGGLWVGKDYARQPAYRRDPLANLSHAATTFQATRVYCALHSGGLVSPQQDQLMLEALSEPAIRHKFVKGLSETEGVQVFRKSGTWRNYHSDSALVRYGEDAYVIVGINNNPQGSEWLERLAEPLHQLATHP